VKRADRAALETRYKRQRNDARFTLPLAVISITVLLYYYGKQQVLLYGDAVAHLNIARRVIDNRHPIQSYGQLGTVWLPLQHIAMLPFVWVNTLWQSGIAGAIPGMVAYVLGTLGVYRLVRARAGDTAAYFAAAIYALNPNLLYMQTTAMNEPIFLAFFVWSLVYLDEFVRATYPALPNSTVQPAQLIPQRALEYCGITLYAGALTRYDGWFSAAILIPVLAWFFFVLFRRTQDARQRRTLTKSFIEVLFLNALVPVYWLVYTWAVSGNALDFINGPYSAKAIALRTTAKGAPPYPGQNHAFTAGLYFLKSAQLNMGSALWGHIALILVVLGTALAVWRFRQYGFLLLLWLPLAFYSLSIAYGSVPIYIPAWYPFSYYNVRYGLELLPVFAVFPALVATALLRGANVKVRSATAVLVAAIVAASYISAYAGSPITLREAQVNSRDRNSMEHGMAGVLVQLPPNATLLMYEAEHAGALRLAGIPLRHVISEAEHPDWEVALLDPARNADFAVGCKGDPVWAAINQHRDQFTELITVSAPWQASCTVYKPKIADSK
jgi:4-amino-4-deoxy-L-arabinose transferase-like glycosyltransferase